MITFTFENGYKVAIEGELQETFAKMKATWEQYRILFPASTNLQGHIRRPGVKDELSICTLVYWPEDPEEGPQALLLQAIIQVNNCDLLATSDPIYE